MQLLIVGGGGDWISAEEMMLALTSDPGSNVILITTDNAMLDVNVANLVKAAEQTGNLAGQHRYGPELLLIAPFQQRVNFDDI